MPGTIELTDLDALIDDLDERITDTELPAVQTMSQVCTIIVCATVVICA
ncbi:MULTISPECIES: hypothetical protein [unclassified Streptomyces]|nr:hypothetical protein [Streptomyces sp. WAC05374]